MAQIEPAKGGLRWVRSLVSPGLGTPPIEERVVASNNAAGLFRGDLLKEGTDGCLLPAAAGDAASHVMVSCKRYRGSDGYMRTGQFLPASTTYTGTVSRANPLASVVLAIPVKDQLFEVDVPTAAATQSAATALIGQCVDIVANAGDTVTGVSGFTTDTVANFQATTASAQLRLTDIPEYGLSGRINDVTQAYWKGYFQVYEQVTIL
jgi:hypothetical protein